MKKLNKTAKVFAFGLAITLLITLSRAYFLLRANKLELSGQFEIGSNQISMFLAMQEAEKAMLYGEEGFGLAFQQSLYDASKNGGDASTPAGCGTYVVYAWWRIDNQTECYPSMDNIKSSIAESTLASLNTYLLLSPYPRTSQSYEMFIEQKQDKLIARAYAMGIEKQMMTCKYGWDSASPSTGVCGTYYYKPSFRKEIKFNINDFNTVVQQAKSFARNVLICKENNPIITCANQGITAINSAGAGIRWSLCQPHIGGSRTFIICADTGNNLLAKESVFGSPGIRDAEIKFVMSFM